MARHRARLAAALVRAALTVVFAAVVPTCVRAQVESAEAQSAPEELGAA